MLELLLTTTNPNGILVLTTRKRNKKIWETFDFQKILKEKRKKNRRNLS